MFAPITFEEDDRGSLRTVASVQEAVRVLTLRWLGHQGRADSYALDACLAAVEGTGTEEAAREAFLAALREGGVFVRE